MRVTLSARYHLLDSGTHTVLGNILFMVGAFEHSFCMSIILHMWYLKEKVAFWGSFSHLRFLGSIFQPQFAWHFLIERDRLFWTGVTLFWVDVCQCGSVWHYFGSVCDRVGRWNNNDDLTDTYTIGHLFQKLNSENVRVLSCMSPINRVGLTYIQKHFRKSHICENDILYIPLCDRMPFQSYVVDDLKEIILIDSLRPANSKNPISDIIAKVLFEQKEVRFKSYFMTRI